MASFPDFQQEESIASIDHSVHSAVSVSTTVMDQHFDPEPEVVLDCEANYSHMKEMARVEEVGRMLTDIQKSLNKASMQCHLLNVDVVTQFDPHLTETLKNSVEECEQCIANVTTADTEAQAFINSQQDPTTQTHNPSTQQ